MGAELSEGPSPLVKQTGTTLREARACSLEVGMLSSRSVCLARNHESTVSCIA